MLTAEKEANSPFSNLTETSIGLQQISQSST
jgi:hypothetical protein